MKIIIDFYNQKKTLKKFNQNYDCDDDDEHFFLLHKYLVDDGMILYTQQKKNTNFLKSDDNIEVDRQGNNLNKSNEKN